MGRLAAPAISRSGGRSKAASAFNEGVSVPQKDWAALTARNPALVSKDAKERYEATRKAIAPGGELAKYRRR
jgi:hypothetical protein